jgi:exosortase
VACIALLAFSWVLLAVAYFSDSPLLSLLSAILLLAAAFLQVDARWHVPYLWGVWALLWLLVRPPFNRDQKLIEWLQRKSSAASSLFLDWTGVEHLMEGNVLILPGKQFFVDEACSGIVSVLSIIACSAIYGLWRNRAPLHVLLLALAGIGWATLMNVMRITTIAIAFERWGVDWSSGTSHEILGLAIFTFVFLALVSTDYLLLALMAPIKGRGDESIGQPIHFGRKVVAFWNWLGRWGAPRAARNGGHETIRGLSPFAESSEQKGTGTIRPRMVPLSVPSRLALGLAPLLAFGTLAAAQLSLPYLFRQSSIASTQSLERALTLGADVLPPNLAGLQRSGFAEQQRTSDDVFGHHSRVYSYQDQQGNSYTVSCDFPFGPDWHDLTVCYRGIGWEIREMAIGAPPSGSEAAWNYIESAFAKPDGSAAWLVYSVFDEFGARVNPPTRSLVSDIWRSLERKHRYAQRTRLFQVQVWTAAPGTVRPAQREAAQKLLVEARERLHKAVTQ